MVKFKFFGEPTHYVGKTLWEIVGNLKDFGVGRLIVKSTTLKYPEPSFFKILQIQPLEEPIDMYHNRNVIAWIEEVYRGKKIDKILETKDNHFPNFMLVPKVEEEKYYKLEEKYRNIETDKIIPQYVEWPPMLQLLYKKNNRFEKNLPKINTLLIDDVYSKIRLGKDNSAMPKQYCNVYKEETSVEENIREIVRLQKIVNSYELKNTAEE